MPKRQKPQTPVKVIRSWPLSSAATLGSSVRSKGILLEVRARLPLSEKKLLDLEGGALILGVREEDFADHADFIATVSRTMDGIESLAVIPREIEDILTISSAERHRWLKDGRLPSAGTRTVQLRGRARKITFHVFDPRVVEDLLDRGMPDIWRDEDAIARVENRRRSAAKAAQKRAEKVRAKTPANAEGLSDDALSGLKGWEAFDLDDLLG